MAQSKYYAVRKGRNSGIYTSWSEAKAQTDGYPGAIFKSFKDASSAKRYLVSGAGYLSKAKKNDSRASITPPTRQFSVNQKPGQVFTVYTDGSSLSNGKSNSRAGYGIHWPEFDNLDTSGSVLGEQTNNRGELTAIRKSLEQAKDLLHPHDTLVVRADSEYSINCLGKWGDMWERNGWTRKGGNIKNLELIQETRDLLKNLRAKEIRVDFEHVTGHSNEPGNERADELARLGAMQIDTDRKTSE